MKITPFSDINDVVLFGRVKYAPTITENITFLKVSTKFFDRYVLLESEFSLNLKINVFFIKCGFEQQRTNLQK